jgi:hypothetical protein
MKNLEHAVRQSQIMLYVPRQCSYTDTSNEDMKVIQRFKCSWPLAVYIINRLTASHSGKECWLHNSAVLKNQIWQVLLILSLQQSKR